MNCKNCGHVIAKDLQCLNWYHLEDSTLFTMDLKKKCWCGCKKPEGGTND